MPQFTEPIVEEAALAWLETLGYVVLQGPDIAHGRYPHPGEILRCGAGRNGHMTPACILTPSRGLASPFSNPLHLFSR